VGNAIKFTDAGEVAIKAEANNGSFHVSVRDTGPGISAADQAKLFQEFQHKVMVTAAPDLIPPPLINQLKAGGRMVIPVGFVLQRLQWSEADADRTRQRGLLRRKASLEQIWNSC
jgi:protein-L-isoaspartate O-methyltransferase